MDPEADFLEIENFFGENLEFILYFSYLIHELDYGCRILCENFKIKFQTDFKLWIIHYFARFGVLGKKQPIFRADFHPYPQLRCVYYSIINLSCNS